MSSLTFPRFIDNARNNFTVYVDPQGSDVAEPGRGSELQPYQTLQAALAAITANPAVGNYLVKLACGNYGGADIAWPVLLNKNISLDGDSASNTNLGMNITYTSLGLSDENMAMSNVSVSNFITFDLTLATVCNITLSDGGFHVKRIDVLPPGPQVIRMFRCFADGFDISGTCLMDECQFVGGGPGPNTVRAAGYLLMTGCLFASMTATVDGILSLTATIAQGTTLSGAGTLAADASSLLNLISTVTTTSFEDLANHIGYTPATPANWAVVPSRIDTALDDLAAANSIPIQQVIFVAKNGNNATATGSLSRPYANIDIAIQNITDNSDTKKYVVAVAPGDYADPLPIKPNVDVVALASQDEACQTVRISGSLQLHPLWNTGTTGNTRTNIAGIAFNSAINSIDNTIPMASGAIKFQQCDFTDNTSAATFVDPYQQMAILFDSATFNGGANFTGFAQIIGKFNLQAASSYTTSPGAGTIFVMDSGVVVGGAFTINANLGETVNFVLKNTNTILAFGGSLVLNNLGTLNFRYTVDSFPAAGAITNSGATLIPLSVAEGLGYTPAVPGDWAVVPTQVKQALDELAAAGASNLTSVLTAGNNGGGIAIVNVPDMQDSTAKVSVNIENRKLYETDGTTVAADWSVPGKFTITGILDPLQLLLTGPSKKIGATDAGAIFLAPFANQVDAISIRKADGVTSLLSVDSTNSRVGIGNAAPTKLLDVLGLGVIGNDTNRRMSMGGDGIAINRNNSTGAIYDGATGAYQLQHVASGVPANDYLTWLVFNSAGVQQSDRALTIANSGKVGINTISPVEQLDVQGAATFNNNLVKGVATPVSPTDAANKAYVDGGGVGQRLKIEQRTLSGAEVAAKQLTLVQTPAAPTEVGGDLIGGAALDNGGDFTVTGAVVDWNGLGLDGLVIAGSKLRFIYRY